MSTSTPNPVVYPFPIATRQHRLGGKAVDIAMCMVTLGIGWLIWSFVVWGQGQTPGKQIVKLRVYDKSTGKTVKWGHMVLREYLVPFAFLVVVWVPALFLSVIHNKYVSLFAILIVYIWIFASQLVDALWIFKGNANNRLVDIFCKTDVLNESPGK